MENKHVGYLVLGIAIVIVFIIFLFNQTLKEIVSLSCTSTHRESCPMYASIDKQTYLALAIVGILFAVSLLLIFSNQKERVVVKKVKERANRKRLDKIAGELRAEDRKVFELVRKARAIFQAELIEKSGVGKVKMTRILDRLEAKGLVERKRRGMTNIVVLADF
ncbi:MarR family transcriptional regulator [Candidatus Pacearchaeota archaeon]|nr:MAG: MarR family transcriptional regulator [Candidatus Pacearchaeota archaeon]